MPFVSDRWGVEVWWFHGRSSHNSKFHWVVGVNDFWFVWRLEELSWTLFRLLWSLCFTRIGLIESIVWQDLVPRQRTVDCLLIHIPRWGLCDQPLSSHQTFLPEVELRQCVFCKEPLSLWLASRLRNFVFFFGKWVSMLCFLDFDTTFVRRAEPESWELCADAGNSTSSGLSVNPSNHSGRFRKRSSESRLPSLLLFLFWVFLRWSVPLAWSFSSLRSDAGLEDELDESCGGDVEDESLPELVANPGTTRGTKLSVLHFIVFPVFGQTWFFTADPLTGISVVFAEFSNDGTAGVSSSYCTVTNRFGSWTNTCASSWVCTSPLAASSTVGFLDLRKVSNSSELNSFCAHHVHWWCSWIDYELSLLWSFRRRRLHCLYFKRSIERCFVRILELVNIFRQIPCCAAGASFLMQGLLMWSFLEFGAQGPRSWVGHFWDNSSRWTLSFPEFSFGARCLRRTWQRVSIPIFLVRVEQIFSDKNLEIHNPVV